MLCQKCNKNEANIHIVKFVNGEKSDMWVCEECAKSISSMPINLSKSSDKSSMQFQDMIGAFFDVLDISTNSNNKMNKVLEQKIDVICKECSTLLSSFISGRELGCPKCYESFSDEIEKLLEKNQGSSLHTGKIPKRMKNIYDNMSEIKQLKLEIDELVAKEEYEEAAIIRDKINKLQLECCREENNEGLGR